MIKKDLKYFFRFKVLIFIEYRIWLLAQKLKGGSAQ